MSRAIKPDARNTWLWVRSVYTIRCRSETAQKQVSIRQLSSGPGFCGGAAAGRKQLSVYIQSCTMCIPYPILCICSEAYTMTSMPVVLERPVAIPLDVSAHQCLVGFRLFPVFSQQQTIDVRRNIDSSWAVADVRSFCTQFHADICSYTWYVYQMYQ